MRKPINPKAAGRTALVCLLTNLIATSAIVATPVQGVVTTVSRTPTETGSQSQTELVRWLRNPVMARNTPVKADPVVTPTKEQKSGDKKAIGRCWNQLMNHFREIHQAHRSQTRIPKK